ncbi:hypothetical protein Vretimale_14147 [Volvox reticuliferus]|nr:hypothetical protein Vretimale_14147 [Volvox reticuliferus]
MAKSSHSNAKKKLRTQRREQVEKQTAWLAIAEEKRQAALAACLASNPVEPHVVPTAVKDDAMETEKKPVAIQTYVFTHQWCCCWARRLLLFPRAAPEVVVRVVEPASAEPLSRCHSHSPSGLRPLGTTAHVQYREAAQTAAS